MNTKLEKKNNEMVHLFEFLEQESNIDFSNFINTDDYQYDADTVLLELSNDKTIEIEIYTLATNELYCNVSIDEETHHIDNIFADRPIKKRLMNRKNIAVISFDPHKIHGEIYAFIYDELISKCDILSKMYNGE